MTAGECDAEEDLLRKHVNQLGEHFDSVQIFCSRVATDGTGFTSSFCDGSGNWYARWGQITQWVTREDQRTRDRQTLDGTKPKDPEEDEE